ncbi:hypothetical protein CGJ49_23225 [Vibrio parahaemolyticus]|nr:hypothetical protein CGJ52_11670 [Vibrio parahaemolyticus]TOE10499.1 hypothetical protein CGJ51_14005 [Vibrio parahaemolyticus]TOE16548.1 hypothetical protein CGJ49_23225 [Vibrio parahaemolyticus]
MVLTLMLKSLLFTIKVYIVWLIVSMIYLIERQAVFMPKSVIRMKISSGYKIHVSWLAAMIFANQFLRYGLKPQLLMNKSILS